MNVPAVSAPFAPDDSSGLIRRLMSWLPCASSFERADAINLLARLYLRGDLKDAARQEAEITLTRALDDPELRVRRALAQAFASTREAPRHIVLALANDVASVARPVLGHSPLLSDADLVDCVGVGDAVAQTAIARREPLSAPVIAALAEVGERPAALALIGNLAADLRAPALWRLFERFNGDGEFCERLKTRPALPVALRAAIAAAAAAQFAEGADPRRAERLASDGREHAFIAIALTCAEAELPGLVAWLRAGQHLTVSLLMRALASGDVALFTHSLAEMAELPGPRAAGLVRDSRGQGFAALYRRAEMPGRFLPAFRIAAELAAQVGEGARGVDYPLTMRMLRAIEARADDALAPLVALLWRLAGEGARSQARDFVELAAPFEEPAAPPELETAAPPVLLLSVEAGNENHAPLVAIELPETETAIAA